MVKRLQHQHYVTQVYNNGIICKHGYSKWTVPRLEAYHVGGLEVWILIEGGTPEAALEDLDEVENETRPDLHQRAVLLDELEHRTRAWYLGRGQASCARMLTGRLAHGDRSQ